MAHELVRPKWLALHVLMVAAIVVMVSAGLWQLNRLDERKDRNEQVQARGEEPVVPVEVLVGPDAAFEVGEGLRYRPVVVSGRYLADDQVLVRSRSLQGSPGFWVLTPVALADGRAVAVNRGWIPAGAETDGSDVEFATPDGEVVVEGLIEVTSAPDPRPSGTRQTTVARPDLRWYDDHIAADLLPVLVQLEQQDPPQDDELPVPLDPPALDEGPHFSYAVQWFLFTAVALIGYPALLWSNANKRRTGPAPSEPTGGRSGGAVDADGASSSGHASSTADRAAHRTGMAAGSAPGGAAP